MQSSQCYLGSLVQKVFDVPYIKSRGFETHPASYIALNAGKIWYSCVFPHFWEQTPPGVTQYIDAVSHSNISLIPHIQGSQVNISVIQLLDITSCTLRYAIYFNLTPRQQKTPTNGRYP